MREVIAPVAATVGLNAFTPNSSASLLVGERYFASAEEERYSGPKRAAVWPTQAIHSLLEGASLDPSTITSVALNFDPSAYETITHDRRFSIPTIERRNAAFKAARCRLESRLEFARATFPTARIVGVPHHLAHAAYGFAASGFDQATVLILDSVGETTASSVWRARRSAEMSIEPVWSGPDYSSIGFFYGAITEHLGWRPNDEEGTVMALAALGNPARFRPAMRRLIQFDGRELSIDPEYLPPRVRRARQAFTRIFQDHVCKPRAPEAPIEEVHCDLAAAAQERLEELVENLARLALSLTGEQRLVLGGGVAENCVANGKLAMLSDMQAFYVPPAPGDAGTSLGAAIVAHPCALTSTAAEIANPLVGSKLDEKALTESFHASRPALSVTEAAQQLLAWCDAGHIVGLVRGRFEYGPRALGNRSIIASPLVVGVGDRLNRTVKHREKFRPFAPAVRLESVETMFEVPTAWVDLSTMSLALPARGDLGRLPEVVHANGLARLQAVTRSHNPVLWEALRLMEERGDPGVLINTSLNVKGQPICGTADLLDQFADESSVRHFLINDTPYEFGGKVQ